MQILTLNERNLVAGGLQPIRPGIRTGAKANPDLLKGPGGGGYYGGGGGGGGYDDSLNSDYSWFTGGAYGANGFLSGDSGFTSASNTVGTYTVTFTQSNGAQYTQTGNHPDRDNNPLDLEYGSFALNNGAIGDDSGLKGEQNFAIFQTAQDGWDAAMNDIASNYADHTLDQIISILSPSSDHNPTTEMQNDIPTNAGLIGSDPWDLLSEQNQEKFLNSYAGFEGYPVAKRGGFPGN